MTKYILHGGETGIPNEHNKAFYQEWVKNFSNDFVPTILLVYFSRNEDEWVKLEQQDKERFGNHTNNRPAQFVVADKNLEIFKEQIKKSDVIYVRGGSSEMIISAFRPIKDELINLLKDKVYAGSSAGVMVLSHLTASHVTDWREGLGLLPFNSIVHWSPDLQEGLDSFKLNHLDNPYEYILLPETEFTVREY